MNADTVRELLSNATPGEWEYYPDIRPGVFTTLPDTPAKEGYWYDDGYEDNDGNPMIRVYLCTFNKYYGGEDGKGGNCADAELMAAAPAVAQWGLERDAEVTRLRELLTQAVKDYDIGAWRHSARGGDDYPEREWVTQARAALEGTS